MFLKKIRAELFKPLVFINQIIRTLDSLQDKGFSSDGGTLFVGVFCLHFIPSLLLDPILNTPKPKLCELVYMFAGIFINKQFKLPIINFLSKIFASYSRALDLVELMQSKYSMYDIVLYNIFHTLTKKFVEKVLFSSEYSVLSICDYIRLSTTFFVIYAGRDFNIPTYFVLIASAVIFLSLEFHTNFNLFYIKFNRDDNSSVFTPGNKNNNSFVSTTGNKNEEVKKMSRSLEEKNRDNSTALKNSSVAVDSSSGNSDTEQTVIKRGRGRPSKKETLKQNETVNTGDNEEGDIKSGEKKGIKRRGRKKKNFDFL